jgi:hypothetical protein
MATHDYFSAAYPEPWQVLGVKLLPFSFGHYLKLHRLDCAFVSEDAKAASIGDLLLGIVVCSMRSNPDPEQDPFWQWLHRERPDSLCGRLRWHLRRHKLTPAELEILQWGRKVGVFQLEEKAKLFDSYIKLHSKVPPYVEEPSDSPRRESGAHWAQSVIAALVAKCGYTQLEAYNVPMPKAMQDFFKHAETDGSIRLLDPEMVEALP